MVCLKTIGAGLLALASTSFAAAVDTRDSMCVNGPTTRNCWANGFSSKTDTMTKWPETGKVVSYHLEATSEIMSPDGFPREMMVFNKQFPGPTIVADWGDTIEVTVKNSLPNNGTSVHWHGMRQLHSNQMDGVNGITECPIAPGQSRTYTFKATEYGTSWYHSHYSIQYGEGLVGAMQINGPTTDNYDIDLGVLPLTDWFRTPVFTVIAARPQAPPTSDSILVNGTGVLNGTGTYSKMTFTPGKKHLLRLVNTGINNYFHIGIDGHSFRVVAVDLVPVTPVDMATLTIGVGQRYDVIIEADQEVSNYWFRITTGGGACDGPNLKAASNDTTGAIVSYSGAPEGNPTTTFTGDLGTGCADDRGFTPFVPVEVPAPSSAPTTLDLTLDTSAGVFWKVNGVPIDISWSTPTLSYVQNGTYVLPVEDNGLTITGTGWSYWLIQNDTPLPHPIHLHGHNFFTIAEGLGSGAGVSYNLTNAMERDSKSVDAGGYIVIAFPADNPGAWLMHCHIPFHIAGGLGVQFLENPSEIVDSVGSLSIFDEGCASWAAFSASDPTVIQGDSGLKKRTFPLAY